MNLNKCHISAITLFYYKPVKSTELSDMIFERSNR